MTEELKLCINCKHCVINDFLQQTENTYECHRNKIIGKIDLVSGELLYQIRPCKYQRMVKAGPGPGGALMGFECGKEGIFYEKKET